jgi:flagellar hook protein FlgE
MPSFDIPLSGLNADSTALNTIANNLSNMNTTGFKSQTTNFSDLFYQQVGTTGSGDQIQVGTGVQVSSNSTDFTGGSISSTGVSTDAAIDGSGFFVLDAGNGEQLYTRDGNFQTSATGTLESTDGKAVMGYMATNGVISTTGSLSDITIPTSGVMQPSSTTSFSLTQNLDSADPVGATTSGSVKVFDSLGKSYEATVTYTNLGDNKWSYAITLPDTLTAGAATAAAATTMTVAASEPTATAVPTNATVVAPAVTTVPSILTAGNATSTSTNTALAASPNLVNSTNTTTAVTDAQTTPVAGTTMDSYAFAATGLVAAGTTLTINGPGGGPVTVTPTTLVNGVESVTQFETDISNETPYRLHKMDRQFRSPGPQLPTRHRLSPSNKTFPRRRPITTSSRATGRQPPSIRQRRWESPRAPSVPSPRRHSPAANRSPLTQTICNKR